MLDYRRLWKSQLNEYINLYGENAPISEPKKSFGQRYYFIGLAVATIMLICFNIFKLDFTSILTGYVIFSSSVWYILSNIEKREEESRDIFYAYHYEKALSDEIRDIKIHTTNIIKPPLEKKICELEEKIKLLESDKAKLIAKKDLYLSIILRNKEVLSHEEEVQNYLKSQHNKITLWD